MRASDAVVWSLGWKKQTTLPSPKLLTVRPLKKGHPKRKGERLPTTHFQVQTVSLRECRSPKLTLQSLHRSFRGARKKNFKRTHMGQGAD